MGCYRELRVCKQSFKVGYGQTSRAHWKWNPSRHTGESLDVGVLRKEGEEVVVILSALRHVRETSPSACRAEAPSVHTNLRRGNFIGD